MMKRKIKTKHSISFLLAAGIVLGAVTVGPSLLDSSRNSAGAASEEPGGGEGNGAAPGEVIEGEGWYEAVTSDGVTLSVNLDTSEISISDEAAGTVWYSNPQDRDNDAIANGANKFRLGSQAMVTYFTPGALQIQKDNYIDAIANDQFTVEAVDDGIRITYIIGEKPAEYVHPLAIEKERYEAFLETVGDEGRRALNRRYTLTVLEDIKADRKAEMLAAYPGLQEYDLYILRDGISEFVLKDISEAFASTGYTFEDKAADEALAGITAGETEVQNVVMSIYYTLDGGDLIVRVPIPEIDFDPAFPLTQLRLLEYFGAGGPEDEGYIFVPDGSGALINFNSGKLTAGQYLSPVYGSDLAVRQGLQVGMTENIALPVYGIRNGGQAFLAVIEEGSALASIRADIAGRVNSYNTVSPVFQILGQDEVDMKEIAGNNVIMAYQQKAYQGDIRIRYRFLDGGQADYSGMAASYREYLIEEGALEKLEAGALPLNLEVLGAVDKLKSFAGLPLPAIEPLTTFDQTSEIIRDLKDQGVESMNLRLTGWFNGGYRQSLPDNIKVQRQLGSANDFRDLAALAAEERIGFYPDATFTYVHRNSLFDGLFVTRDAARFLDREVVELRKYRPAIMAPAIGVNPYWVIAGQKIPGYAESFLEDYSKLGAAGLMVRDAGRYLGANYDRKQELDRESALRIWSETLEKFGEADLSIMSEYGNAYTLPYTDVLVEVPDSSSRYQITDASVPFLQMTLHGYVDYSHKPLNLSADYRDALLAMLETGANPAFTVMKADNAVLKDSEYNHYFSAEYDAWRDRILSVYTEASEVLGPLRTQTIEKHEILGTGLTAVTYSDGTVIYINRSGASQSTPGGEIAAWDYLVRR